LAEGPFPTAVLAANLGGPEVSTAVAFYCGTFVFGSGAFNPLVEAIARGHLCRPEVDAQAINRIRQGDRITCGSTCSVSGIGWHRQR
jgi:hypothetical protein